MAAPRTLSLEGCIDRIASMGQAHANYESAALEVISDWQRLFGSHPAHTGKQIGDYLSGVFRDVDETISIECKVVLAYDRGMLRSAFLSLFWSVIAEKRKDGTFTFQSLVKVLETDKGKVSKWFNGDPNWTINTIAGLAHALDLDLHISATERSTGKMFTPSGLQTPPAKNVARKPMLGET
jgi:hypothetical protein